MNALITFTCVAVAHEVISAPAVATGQTVGVGGAEGGERHARVGGATREAVSGETLKEIRLFMLISPEGLDVRMGYKSSRMSLNIPGGYCSGSQIARLITALG